MLLFIFLTLLIPNYINAGKSEEIKLRQKLFKYYKSNDRPVINYNDTVTASYGLELISLEKFDQVGEKVKFNLQMKYTWYDEYLTWNKSIFDFEFLNLDPDLVWKPDLELYNSANKPIKINGDGILKVFYTGHMYWIVPVIYDYSCPLQLENFPFDTQRCKMTFGSWKLSKNYLNISTHLLPIKHKNNEKHNGKLFEAVAFDKFKHNEWNVNEIKYKSYDTEYLCCPGELWTISEMEIIMERNYHKYIIVIIMTFFLTLSAITVSLFLLERYIRTYLLVFIPLSTIWLQLYISSKIPVIEYPTKMENFIQLSYYISMISAIYSGILYNIANYHFKSLKLYFTYKEFKSVKLDKINDNTYIIKNDNEGYKNYYVFNNFSYLLYNTDIVIRSLLLSIYVSVSLYLFI